QHAQHDCFAQEYQLDFRISRAYGESQPNLSRALSDGHQHDIHDADATHEQVQRRNASQKYGQNPAGRKLSLYYVLRAADVEVVSFRWIEMVALTQQSHNLLGSLRHGSRETAEQKMSSSQNVPVILFCTV